MTASQVQAQQASGPSPFMCPKRNNSALSNASSSSSLNDDEESDLMALSSAQQQRQAHAAHARGYHARSVSTERSFTTEGEPPTTATHQARAPASDRKGTVRTGSVFATPSHHKLSTGDAPTASALAAPSHMYARASSMRATTASASSSSNRNTNGASSSGAGSAQIETVYLYGTPTAPRKQLYQRL